MRWTQQHPGDPVFPVRRVARAGPLSPTLPRQGGGSSRAGHRAHGWLFSRGLSAVALGLALLATAPGALAAADESIERELIRITNVDRTSNGLGSLLPEGRLTGLARERSEDMLARNYFSHNIPPSGEKVFAEMERRGFVYEAAGENLGWNTAARDATVQFVQRDFMNSPTHRENVLRDVFTQIGAGSVPGTGRIMHTVLFMKPTEAVASAPTVQPTEGVASAPTVQPTETPEGS